MHYAELISRSNRTDHAWWATAVSVALNSPGVGGRNKNTYRLGSVLTNKRRLYTARHNSYKTHPLLIKFTDYPYLHAESAAIFAQGIKKCENLSLYTVRLMRNGHIAPAHPCEACRAIMKLAGLESAFVSTYEGFEMILL